MADPEGWGISRGYWDVSGNWRESPADTIESILTQMGAAQSDGPPSGGVMTVRLDRPHTEMPRGRVVLEDGGEVFVDGELPADFPSGYHTFEHPDGASSVLIATPGTCPLPLTRQWGFAAQLYGVRSRSSWGMGDFADLSSLCDWSAGLGAGLLVVNPLHATAPTPKQEVSPYSPGSRCFLNPLYLAVERVPGAAEVDEVRRLAPAARRLNEDPLVDRDRVWSMKSEALEAVFSAWCERGPDDAEFAAYRSSRGSALERFAAYSALTELHGSAWQDWPVDLRHPSGSGVGDFLRSRDGRRRVLYHTWIQWIADRQLADAGRFGPGGVGIVQDLAVGINRDGADGWMWQDVFALGMDVGAPPDEFNTRGQNWALPPLDPWRLRSCGYEPWIESLRGVLRHAGGVRVDHVMGLFRLFWIPTGSEPSQGAYVRYPSNEMLDILTLEAHRAGAVVVGEDLGTVENEVRAELYERQILSYRVWWFEPGRTPSWPERALAAVTTHDLPTIAGVLDRSDLAAQQQCGMKPSEDASERLRDRLLEWTSTDRGGGDGDAGGTGDAERVILRAYEDLAKAPCLLLTVGLEDALAVPDRPNMPGTTDEWPNWRQVLPLPLETIEQLELPRSIAALLAQSTRTGGGDGIEGLDAGGP